MGCFVLGDYLLMFVSTLKMEALQSFETLGNTCSATAQHYFTEDLNLQQHHCENVNFTCYVAACDHSPW
jgi:hypothetical protein